VAGESSPHHSAAMLESASLLAKVQAALDRQHTPSPLATPTTPTINHTPNDTDTTNLADPATLSPPLANSGRRRSTMGRTELAALKARLAAVQQGGATSGRTAASSGWVSSLGQITDEETPPPMLQQQVVGGSPVTSSRRSTRSSLGGSRVGRTGSPAALSPALSGRSRPASQRRRRSPSPSPAPSSVPPYYPSTDRSPGLVGALLMPSPAPLDDAERLFVQSVTPRKGVGANGKQRRRTSRVTYSTSSSSESSSESEGESELSSGDGIEVEIVSDAEEDEADDGERRASLAAGHVGEVVVSELESDDDSDSSAPPPPPPPGSASTAVTPTTPTNALSRTLAEERARQLVLQQGRERRAAQLVEPSFEQDDGDFVDGEVRPRLCQECRRSKVRARVVYDGIPHFMCKSCAESRERRFARYGTLSPQAAGARTGGSRSGRSRGKGMLGGSKGSGSGGSVLRRILRPVGGSRISRHGGSSSTAAAAAAHAPPPTAAQLAATATAALERSRKNRQTALDVDFAARELYEGVLSKKKGAVDSNASTRSLGSGSRRTSSTRSAAPTSPVTSGSRKKAATPLSRRESATGTLGSKAKRKGKTPTTAGSDVAAPAAQAPVSSRVMCDKCGLVPPKHRATLKSGRTLKVCSDCLAKSTKKQ